MANPKPKIVVLYGSQSGTAEEVAERVTREAIRFNLRPYLSSMDEADLEQLHGHLNTVICFVCSTTGQGNEPDNMKKFWLFLRKKDHAADLFKGIKYAVLGLGDSSYSQFNVVAKKLFKRVGQLGATPLVDLGLADEQHELGSDAFIDPWVLNFWRKTLPGFDELPMTVGEAPLQPKFVLVDSERQLENGEKQSIEVLLKKKSDHPVEKHFVVDKERVTDPHHFQDVKLITFELHQSNFTYKPGDVLMIQPYNADYKVEEFFTSFPHLNQRRNEKFFIMPNPERSWVKIPPQLEKLHPQPWSLYDMVKYFFDIQAVPKRYFFEILSHFTADETERGCLLNLASPEGQEDLFKYAYRPKRSTLEALQDFPHALENIPEDYFFDLIPPIKPRAFSIASAMREHREKPAVQILMAVVKYSTTIWEIREGLCSTMLSQAELGTDFPIWIEKGSYKFPSSEESTPIIMVGPGTGCAPFRSLISDRFDKLNQLVLFFGCRNEAKDFFFKDEWQKLEQQNRLTLITAFSRDGPQGQPKTYVQQKIVEHASTLSDLILNKGAYIYVAGNAKQMPIGVFQAFKDVVEQAGVEDADAVMKELSKAGRYQTEVWS